jgi:predicted flavoprotein YhiN
VSLYRKGVLLAEDVGEVQFTADSLSGICIFNLSRHMRGNNPVSGDSLDDVVHIDFLPEMKIEEVDLFLDQLNSIEKRRKFNDFGLRGMVHAKIAQYLEGLLPSENSDGFVTKTSALLKDLRIPVKGVKGWKNAQVTSGGVDLAEVDSATMASTIVPGLFFAGEVLDYDGPSGGFNLDHAWTSGILAGRAAAGSE